MNEMLKVVKEAKDEIITPREIIADLLEALKDLVTDYEEIGGEDIYADAYNRAKQAIRKAEEQIK